MINSTLNAVTKQLGTTFGTGYHYYVEDVEQGLKKPCFTVNLLVPLQRSKSPVLYDRTMPLVIHYFSDSKHNLKSNCYEIGEQLIECLEYLPFKGTVIRGENISWRVADGVLQAFVTYKFTTRRVTENEECMEVIRETVSHGK